ncbi:metallophosphoesterase [Cellulophaga sp. HaHaR_3_176]|uniref:metallophosphoesterase n=1 Tax=Cellulophaga sp. HaHaR_3_176 TaxID=1942464 RepID=UPI001C1FC433|nr:metallophosphoesterase [Cellulophaga sp. HaHaR_3_176]QWX83214.1 metallophosphoesterase [Cellulophaga sp. HaHaR_3_176]
MGKHFSLIIFLLLTGCATYHSKYENLEDSKDAKTTKEISHTLYLIGDAGLSPLGGMNPVLKSFKKKLNNASENSTAIFLGDNIYPAGLPDPIDSTLAYRTAASHLNAQISTLENFKGNKFFIPGNHDWYTEGLVGLEREQDYIQEKLDSDDVFFPEDGCPINIIEVNDDVVIVALDTEWYMTNWDKRPGMNDKCEIKSREKFFLEIEDIIKDYRDKTTIIALHHPVFTYGPHGGESSLKQQLFPTNRNIPLPILGSLANLLRKTAGPSIADKQNKLYTEFTDRITTLAQFSDKVIFTSGHEHTLQYIVEKGLPQIVSGSGSKKGVSRLINGSKFSTGAMGYATLEIYKDGSSKVRFFGLDKDGSETFLYGTEVLPSEVKYSPEEYETNFPATVEASVYEKEETEKSRFFKKVWGERYRKYYATKVKAPTVRIDTLFGGLKPVKMGGGHQSKSLRLQDKDGKEYVMRALKKSAELYLQSMLFQDQYVLEDLKDTYTQEILEDFYTGSHPYGPFTVATLSDAANLYHTNPVLYYVPKQEALKEFNANFGDELYMIEEHAGDGHGDLKSFGYADELKSTDTMLEDLRDDEKYSVDTSMYIRARLFDMVVGDWDRHTDQWRWVEQKDKKTKKVIYKPFPRDRDQIFSKMGDGALMNIATRVVNSLKIMEGFTEKIRSVKGFNSSPKTFVLDMVLFPETTFEQWQKEASFLQENLTPEVIDNALQHMPEEVRDKVTLEEIKRIVLARLSTIDQTASEYYSVLNRYAVIVGTDKDDWFEVNRINENETQVKAYRNIGDEKKKLFFEKTFNKKYTKEIWIYGLDDDDLFEVNGENKSAILVRLIGGQNNDIYDVEASKKVRIYDYKSKKSTFKNVKGAKVKLSDDYVLNTYQPLKPRVNSNLIIPTIGFNPDDGVKIGIQETYVRNNFRLNPFTQKHDFNASYFFATGGFEVGYKGEFAHIFENWNLEIAARVTTPNFSTNFFGFGNETENLDDDLSLDYNRVKLETLNFAPSLVWRGRMGSKFRAGLSYETIEVEETDDRFVNSFYQANGEETRNSFLGADVAYDYENKDNAAFPTMGMETALNIGYKKSITAGGNGFGYVIPSVAFNYKLISSGKLVLATKWKAHFNIGNDFEFYQGASIGGNDGLRGFRNQRFTGKTAYYQNTDLRFSFRKKRTSILPTALGFFGGFDYGKVWISDFDSKRWHTSYGGGLFLNTADILSINAGVFNSEDGLRATFGVGFGF